ncbi:MULTISPECIES: hypothetical protein [Marinobacter]|uniref:Uncharacterized protein n=1 Tax=Marinobacter profundi TaxID=2666256 RepID=A0A2G1UIS2_9GAMM|nr:MULTISPECIES: hypothetical protein [Marinobacter]MBD3655217.1 hypothetical protein [Marinobacter sp.]PHQ14319.1 hypothetical protein CLH61_13440 [Marinobacter profundi]
MISTLAEISRNVAEARTRLLGLVAVGLLAGCSANPIYTTTGIVLSNYSEGEATPYVLQMSDPEMACALGEGVDPLLYSFSRVTDAPDTTGSLLMLLAANCSEYRAWDAELDYLRADFQGNVPAAKDARELAKRMNAEVAKRRLMSFERAMRAYEYDPGAENAECPFLFAEQDELTFMLGLLTGMQAIVNDANSGSMAGVPRNIAPQAERAAQCLDNEKWGGLPNAIRALVWLLIPDTRPSLAPDPWVVLEDSSRLSIEKGFRASMALEAVAAETFGRPDVLKDVIARFAEADNTIEVWDDYRLVDEVARDVIMFSSDKQWTANYGYRTPRTFFGQLSPERAGEEVETMSLDDLL